MATTDRQREQVYQSERVFHTLWEWHHEDERQGTRWMPWPELVEYTETLYADALATPYRHQRRLVRGRKRLAIVRAPKRATTSSAWWRDERIAYHEAQYTVRTAIHEVAHLLAGGEREAGHGWRFANVLRQMLGRHLAPDAERLMRSVYGWFDVRDLRAGMRDGGPPPYRFVPLRPVVNTQWDAVIEEYFIGEPVAY